MEPMREINAAETIISFKREVKIPQLATSLVGRVNRISQVAPTGDLTLGKVPSCSILLRDLLTSEETERERCDGTMRTQDGYALIASADVEDISAT